MQSLQTHTTSHKSKATPSLESLRLTKHLIPNPGADRSAPFANPGQYLYFLVAVPKPDLYGVLVLNFANLGDFFRDHFPSDRFP